jgi:CBS domain-containing protein
VRIIKNIVKDREPFFVRTGQNLLDVVKYMCDKHIGAVAVVDNEQNLVGIFSERDLMKRVVVKGLDVNKLKVDDVMTKNPMVGYAEESYEECMSKMKQINSRHLPIVDNGKLVGMVSLRDLLLENISEKEEEIKMMNAYIHTVPPSNI